MINPLQKKQVELLEKIGCADAARKINEIVGVINNNQDTKPKGITNEDELINAIINSDTEYDARMILKDYIKKIK